MLKLCNWCGQLNVLSSSEKKYCSVCENNCVRECKRCHRPFPCETYFTLSNERCDTCERKYLKESSKNKLKASCRRVGENYKERTISEMESKRKQREDSETFMRYNNNISDEGDGSESGNSTDNEQEEDHRPQQQQQQQQQQQEEDEGHEQPEDLDTGVKLCSKKKKKQRKSMKTVHKTSFHDNSTDNVDSLVQKLQKGVQKSEEQKKQRGRKKKQHNSHSVSKDIMLKQMLEYWTANCQKSKGGFVLFPL